MNGRQLREIRKQMGLTPAQLAKLIGYTGTPRNDAMLIRKMENAKKKIPLYIAHLIWLLGQLHESWRDEPPDLLPPFMREENGQPNFPSWPGYEFDHSPDPQHEAQEDGAD